MNNYKQQTKPVLVDHSGMIPPQAIEIEQAILGSFIIEPEAYLLNPVSPELFYKAQNLTICEVIRDMSKAGKTIDLRTVTQTLHEKKLLESIGGAMYIMDLLHGIASAAHLPQHIMMLKDKYMRREMIKMSHELLIGAYDESNDLDNVIESAQSIFMKMLSDEGENVKTFSEVALTISDTMAQNTNDQTESTGIPTGFKCFDEFAYGMQPGDLVVIAGESSHGKTMMATNIINHAAKQGYPVDVHSLEMSAKQLVSRILSIESGISAKDMLFQKMLPETITHIEKHISKLDGLPIYFDDNSTSSSSKICASIRKMVLKYGVKLVMIDYLQLVSGDSKQGREEEIGQNARVFKNIAKELNIVVILISQLSNSESHVPTASRLRGSGQIKEASDITFLVWIPEKEGVLTIKNEATGCETDTHGKAQIIMGKGRNTGTMDFIVNCHKEINKMWDETDYSMIPCTDFYEPDSLKQTDKPF